jgi:UDP-MurNAc hydroxylase
VTIPIASYIYFCHEENFYLNDSINTARKTYDFLAEHTDTAPVILYNNEEYEFGQVHDNEKSIEMYEDDFASISANKDVKLEWNVPKGIEEITAATKNFVTDMRENNSAILKFYLRDSYIFLWDHNQSFRLSLSDGLVSVSRDEDQCDVSLSSESLLFCIKFPYGLDTTQINGRLQKPKAGNYSRFYNFFRINHLKSRGIKLNPNYLFGSVVNKALVKLKLREI